MDDLKICTRCIQPNTRPGIFFNEQSVCGACLWEDEKKKIDWSERTNELKNIISQTKKSNAIYDCVIGVSGGKDSTFQALTARDSLGLRCLLVNYQPDNIHFRWSLKLLRFLILACPLFLFLEIFDIDQLTLI